MVSGPSGGVPNNFIYNYDCATNLWQVLFRTRHSELVNSQSPRLDAAGFHLAEWHILAMTWMLS